MPATLRRVRLRTTITATITSVVALAITGCGDNSSGGAPETSPLASSPAPNGPADSEPVGPAASAEPTDTAADPAAPPDTVVVDVAPDAMSVNVIAPPGRNPIVAWTTREAVFVAELDVATAGLGEPLSVSGDVAPFAHPIERPALAVDGDGRLHVAYTTFAGATGSVQHVVVDGELAVSPPTAISGAPQPETVLVHAATDSDGAPVFAWLEDSTLSVATTSADGGIVEHELVDGLTCDCCNPTPIDLGDRLAVAYRDRSEVDVRVVRDATVVVRADDDAAFGEPVVVADDHWFLDACPFSGPSVAVADGHLVVAWMDGRQTVHPDQDGTTIWVDRSADGGVTFGDDVAITDGGIHRWPVMAAVGTVIHLVWEVQARDGGLAYASSSDGGASFGRTTMLVDNADATGLAKNPSIAHADGVLLVTWTDSTGARLLIRQP